MLSLDANDPSDDVFQSSESELVVVKQLGAGLQGCVVLALDTTTQHYVGVKLPTFECHEGTRDVTLRHLDCQVQSILQERDALRLVDHPNIVRYERSLSGRKSRHAYVSPLPETTCKVYLHQLLLAVAACHAAGVVHRDVKPENILFDDAFTLKLCDFGLATVLPPEQVHQTNLANVEGTQLYMAPEITSGTPFHGPPVDLWACGVVLYIMLTGYPPFECAEASDPWYVHIVSGDMTKFWTSQPASMSKPSPLAIDLINGLLHVDASQRLTVVEALTHPWLGDVSEIDADAVQRVMNERRRRCLEVSSGPHKVV